MRARNPKTTTCFQCKTEHPDQHYERVVYNKHELHGPWAGWRMAGKDLVSPDGDRISPHRLRGFLWTEHAKRKLRRSAPQTKVLERNAAAIIPARERFGGSA